MAQRSKIKKTTIVDIAAASGVSVTTVSRILNDKPDVAEETREREAGDSTRCSGQDFRRLEGPGAGLHGGGPRIARR